MVSRDLAMLLSEFVSIPIFVVPQVAFVSGLAPKISMLLRKDGITGAYMYWKGWKKMDCMSEES